MDVSIRWKAQRDQTFIRIVVRIHQHSTASNWELAVASRLPPGSIFVLSASNIDDHVGPLKVRSDTRRWRPWLATE